MIKRVLIFLIIASPILLKASDIQNSLSTLPKSYLKALEKYCNSKTAIPIHKQYKIQKYNGKDIPENLNLLFLRRHGEPLFVKEKSLAFLWYDDTCLNVVGVMEDSDIGNEAIGRHSAPHAVGDTFEIFIQPSGDFYYELHMSPSLATLEVAFPTSTSFKHIPGGLKTLYFDAGMKGNSGKFSLKSGIKGWWVHMKIPFANIGTTAEKLKNTRFLICRYNFNIVFGERPKIKPELSTILEYKKNERFHKPSKWLTFDKYNHPISNKNIKPIWELGRNPIYPALVKGDIKLIGGVVKLDGTNSFSIPKAVIGNQHDYTIEFEVKQFKDTTKGDGIDFVSNTDEINKTGLKLRYYPPSYNCGWLYTNGSATVEYRGFLRKNINPTCGNKITIVAKDKQLMMFRDGLLIASTGKVNPSDLPITFGSVEKKSTHSYEIKNIKIYNQPIFPDTFDSNSAKMRSYSGDQYFMQRVDLKNPSLPRILIIGDSISGGYRKFISKMLKDKANVDYWMIGYKYMGGKNSPMERALTGILSNGPYDVVTFNFGLHYWTKPERSPEDKHIPWMTKIVKHLKKASPKTAFIWIRTTPWRTTPDTGRATLKNEKNERIIRFNKMTDEIMEKHGVSKVDLYSLSEKELKTVPIGSKDNVHWNAKVSQMMAKKIINEIQKNIKIIKSN